MIWNNIYKIFSFFCRGFQETRFLILFLTSLGMINLLYFAFGSDSKTWNSGSSALKITQESMTEQFPRIINVMGSCKVWQVAPGVVSKSNIETYVLQKCSNICINRKLKTAAFSSEQFNTELPADAIIGTFNIGTQKFSGSYSWASSLNQAVDNLSTASIEENYTEKIRNISGVTWFLDVTHGLSDRWNNLCHWSDHVFSMFDAMVAAKDLFDSENMWFNHVFMGQIYQGQHRMSKYSWFKDTLQPVVQFNERLDGGKVDLLFKDSFEENTICFDEVVLPRYGMGYHFSSADNAEQFKAEYSSNFGLKKPQNSTIHKVVFINRKATRVITNMEVLMKVATDVLRSKGLSFNIEVEMVYMEGMSTAEQIEVFSSASIVVAAHGAALTNIVMMRKGTILLEIFPCGLYSDTYKFLANEVNTVHFSVRLNSVPTCSKYLGRTHILDNFEVPVEDFLKPISESFDSLSKFDEMQSPDNHNY